MPLVIFRHDAKHIEELRERKKAKTRLEIRDAALSLFAEHGYEATTVEQIAERAETSTTSFFRYFRGKADVFLDGYGSHLPALRQRIIDRPSEENDLIAVARALHEAVPAEIDPVRTARTALAVASSSLLRGIAQEASQNWVVTITEGLAERHGPHTRPEDYRLTTRLVLGAFNETVDAWIASGCKNDFGDAIDATFRRVLELCALWACPDPTSA